MDKHVDSNTIKKISVFFVIVIIIHLIIFAKNAVHKQQTVINH